MFDYCRCRRCLSTSLMLWVSLSPWIRSLLKVAFSENTGTSTKGEDESALIKACTWHCNSNFAGCKCQIKQWLLHYLVLSLHHVCLHWIMLLSWSYVMLLCLTILVVINLCCEHTCHYIMLFSLNNLYKCVHRLYISVAYSAWHCPVEMCYTLIA